METIKVYRYENEEGVGPYISYSEVQDNLVDAHDTDYYPCWREDFNVRNKEDYYSACLSKKALVWWFNGFNVRLYKEGFSIKEYSIPKENVEYGKSGKQLRFKKV